MGKETFCSPPVAQRVFLSYRRIDDRAPPENPKACYVKHFREQLLWELQMKGVPETVVWMDRYNIEPGDEWNEIIESALQEADLFIALLSNNYITSPWCDKELSAMAARIRSLDGDLRKKRIFRADKHPVADDKVHEVLKSVQAVRFYDVDKDRRDEVEYYYRGRVRPEFYDRINELAVAIQERLNQLGVQMKTPVEEPAFLAPVNGRKVFVAKPANDMRDEYINLITALKQAGYSVADLSELAEQPQSTVSAALADAELSIHLLGDKAGFRPEGIDKESVAFQLAQAALEAAKRPSFYRLIYAPKVVHSQAIENPHVAERDPFAVLARFGSFLPSDQVVGDTPTSFGQFVLQRLSTLYSKSGSKIVKPKPVYIHYVGDDRNFATEVFKRLKAEGYSPTLAPDPADGVPEDVLDEMLAKTEQTILCWANAAYKDIVTQLNDSIISRWRASDPDRRAVWLYIGGAASSRKEETLELNPFGNDVEKMVDMRRQNEGSTVQ
ncbi:toll/interleukin-1 receptor domain-containing protein [uncultured Rhodoblastus sp.]|uniref:toll/interleukin-1 receptor domain-containing protein n=1 Tax=uncultured Rhodoblastus sp. TaxID=543037 RepID=UPI00260127DE|nr:toll/interleukin-1 receptor domain-containing protein [uncultured Rhodoblastus sp.]